MSRTQIELDARQMKDFLHHVIKTNRMNQAKGLHPAACEVIGESGLGKTSVSIQIAEELDIAYEKVNLAQIDDLGDLVGFPIRQFQMQKYVTKLSKNAEGQTIKQRFKSGSPEWIDENATSSYQKLGWEFTNQKRMSYCPPEWIADKEGGGILMLDDWNRADIRFIQAVMELIDRGEYISWKLPKDWHIILTANPDDGEYLVQSIDRAQRTRFTSFGLKWDVECWAEWAERAGIDSRCINFTLMTPEIVKDDVNPRSLVTFYNLISSIEDFEQKESLAMIRMIGQGNVGAEVAEMFALFIANRLDKIVSPKEMLLGQSHEIVAERMKLALNTDTGDYKGSVASLLATRFINYTVHYSEKNPITDEIIDRIKYLIKDNELFTNDLNYVVGKRIFNGNKQKFQKLIADPVIQAIILKD